MEQSKGILVTSFGTTHPDTRKNTIEAIERHLMDAFPDRKFYRGWTSRMIVKILRERYSEEVDTVQQALDRARRDGIEDLLVQPTYIMEGAESDRMRQLVLEARESFATMKLGRPLLHSKADIEKLAKILAARLMGDKGPADALILMGHGSAEKAEANRVYVDLEEAFRALGHENIFVSTVEGSPDLEDALTGIERLGKVGTVYLAPLMTVAGDHAKNDMAGEEEGSWKNRVSARGYEAVPILKGLGEYEEVREMLAEHAKEAEEI